MSRPLKINNTSPISLKEMSDSDIEYIAYRVLYEFANIQSGAGTLNFNGIGTNIGSFVDTSRPYSIGEHPVGTEVNTNTITFYQDRRTTTPNPSARPMIWNGSSLQEINNSQLNNRVLLNAGVKLTTGGLGSYYLSPTAPTSGSWIQIGSFNDTFIDGQVTYNLFRKTNDSLPPVVRPLKTVTGGMREMNDSEIESLVGNLREYIRTTGVGYYVLQEPVPTNGTYVTSGDNTSDTRYEIKDVDYTGTRTFTRFFSGRRANYTGTRDFTGTTVLNNKETISTRTLWVRQS